MDVEIEREALERAWEHALRHPGAPIEDHHDPRVLALGQALIAQLALDERDDGRFARVSIGRADGASVAATSVEPVAQGLFDAVGIAGYPVHCVRGSDDEMLHFVVDLEGLKQSRRMDHVARAVAITGAAMPPSLPVEGEEPCDAEVAAIQFTLPLPLIAKAWDLGAVRNSDPQHLTYLSDLLLVPRAWVEFQADFFLAELEDGYVDERGNPREPS